MIDGAHVLTPGVLRFGMAGLATYAPAIVATQQWYVGPGPAGRRGRRRLRPGLRGPAVRRDRLADRRLPALRHRPLHRRPRLVRRHLGEQLPLRAATACSSRSAASTRASRRPAAATPTSTSTSGSASSPDVTVVDDHRRGLVPPGPRRHHDERSRMPTSDGASSTSYASSTRELRGRPFRGPSGTMHFVGSMPPRAARTKAASADRARTSSRPGAPDPDALPEQPLPIPEDLETAFVDAFWRSHAWRETTLARAVRSTRPATDLIAYQELLTRVRPDWIVETGTGNGGRALFLASICELLGHGQVLSVDAGSGRRPPAAPADHLPDRRSPAACQHGTSGARAGRRHRRTRWSCSARGAAANACWRSSGSMRRWCRPAPTS